MTTITIIVVVALVFFITICVVAFIVWKRESELRTDSIQAIEQNLEKLSEQLSGDVLLRQTAGQASQVGREAVPRDRDPFGWVKEESSQEPQEMQRGPARGGDDDNHQSNDIEETQDFTDRFPETAPERPPKTGADRTEQQAGPQDGQWDMQDGQADLRDEPSDFPEIQLPDVSRDFPEIDISGYGFEPLSKGASEYNVAKSGREYTATELETLIKE